MRRETGVVPLEAAGGDEPPGLRLGVGDQHLIVDVNEPVRRQHLPPMGHQPLVLTKEEHQVAPVRGVLTIEVGGEDGKSGVDRVAPAVDEGRVGEDAVDEAESQEIIERLVGDPFRSRPERPQRRQIIVGKALRRLRGRGEAPNVLARRVARVPELQFAARRHFRMTRQDLLSQGGARTGHPDDKDWRRVRRLLDRAVGRDSRTASPR